MDVTIVRTISTGSNCEITVHIDKGHIDSWVGALGSSNGSRDFVVEDDNLIVNPICLVFANARDRATSGVALHHFWVAQDSNFGAGSFGGNLVENSCEVILNGIPVANLIVVPLVAPPNVENAMLK